MYRRNLAASATRAMSDQIILVGYSDNDKDPDPYAQSLPDTYRCVDDKERLLLWYTQKTFVERFAPRTRIVDRCCWPVKTNMMYKNWHLLASDGAAIYRIIYMAYMCTIYHNYVSTTDV